MTTLRFQVLALMFVITVLPLNEVASANTRGVLCSGTSMPGSLNDEQLVEAFKCAHECLREGEASCQTNGFGMNWSPVACTVKASGTSAFTCS